MSRYWNFCNTVLQSKYAILPNKLAHHGSVTLLDCYVPKQTLCSVVVFLFTYAGGPLSLKMVCWSSYWALNTVCLSGNYQECRALYLHWGLLTNTRSLHANQEFQPATMTKLSLNSWLWEFQAHSQPLVKGSSTVKWAITRIYLSSMKQPWVVCSLQNQFFISSMAKHHIKNQIVQAIADRIIRAHKDGKRFRVIIVLPQKPEFASECFSNLNNCIL